MSELWASFWEGFAEGLSSIFGPFSRKVRPFITFGHFRNLVAWGIACYLGWNLIYYGWYARGEVTCDFAGQWLMGRMFAGGRAQELFIVPPEKIELACGYVSGDPDATAVFRDWCRREPSAAADFLSIIHGERCYWEASEFGRTLAAAINATPTPLAKDKKDPPPRGLDRLNFEDYRTMANDILRKGMDPVVRSNPSREPLTVLYALGLTQWPVALPPLELVESVVKKEFVPWDPLVEGPLYPPTAGLIFLPLGFLSPTTAHHVVTLFYVLSVIPSGFFISRSTKKRLGWGEAALLILCFPNFLQVILLGQNSLLTLLLTTAGWYCYSRKKPFLAGLIWSLLAYKPVFAVGLLVVPLALPSWRMVLGMVAGGILFVASTLPFVGVGGLDRLVTHNPIAQKVFGHAAPQAAPGKPTSGPFDLIDHQNWPRTNAWERWFIVGKHAAAMYMTDRNWIWMSRDLTGLPFRRIWKKPLPADGKQQSEPNAGADDPWDDWRIQMHYLYHRYFKGVDTYNAYGADGLPRDGYATTDEFERDHLQAVNYDDGSHSLERTSLLLIGSVAGLTLLAGWLGRLTAELRGFAPDSVFEVDRQALLLTGGLLSVYHFMHYDVTLFSLPAALCLSQLARYGWFGRAWIIFIVAAFGLCAYDMWYPKGVIRFPLETALMLLLWGGCLFRVIWNGFMTSNTRSAPPLNLLNPTAPTPGVS